MFDYKELDSDQTKDEIHIRCVSAVISKFLWLIDTFNLDYFISNNWSKLPKSWAECLENFEIENIESLLSKDSKLLTSNVLPLSLLSFRSTCFALQLNRNFSDNSEIKLFGQQFRLKDKILESELKNSINPNMKSEILNRKIKHKKRHEIVRLSHLLDQLLKSLPNCKTVIDCGSGQGHLSRVLSLCFGYDVISIEANEDNIFGAQNKDTNTLESLKRYRLTDEIHSQFPKKVNQLLNNNSSISDVTENGVNNLLLGLHACGPLSNIILKQFSKCPETKALALVSCCYMKSGQNFPMSQLVANHCVDGLSYAIKEGGCHAIEKFIDKLKNKENLDSLKVHCFRAILESLIVKFSPHMRHKPLRSVRITEDMKFKEYSLKAINGLDICIPEEELDSPFVRKCLEHQKKVIIFYSLRLLMSPLVETFILLDYINYLKEKGIKTALLPVFDPIVSPRNHVLIAIK